MQYIVIILILLVLVLLFLYGGQAINRNTPPLSIRYPELTNLILSGHSNNRIVVDYGNKLLIGVSSSGGSTTFSLSETQDNNLQIKYAIKNNPLIADFELRFEFTQNSCLQDSVRVYERLDALIGKEIQKKMTSLS